MQIDVFNGDADGICALVQLRLAEPKDSTLITGIKRDIQLLKKVDAGAGDSVTVLDISMEKNQDDLHRLLQAGARVFYVDHHRSGDIPQHENLQSMINTDASVCTSLLVNDYLQGKYAAWAVAAAFGDNLNKSAIQAAQSLNLTEDQLEKLKELGICINYNGYGSSVDDLHFAPDQLFKELSSYKSPFEFMQNNADIYHQLVSGYTEDMANADKISAEHSTDKVAVFVLPDEIWARRISGVFGNHLANLFPERAHAIISNNNKGGYQVSVRAPLSNQIGADDLCSTFATGGGRKGAAGINHLPMEELNKFVALFEQHY